VTDDPLEFTARKMAEFHEAFDGLRTVGDLAIAERNVDDLIVAVQGLFEAYDDLLGAYGLAVAKIAIDMSASDDYPT
jgi:hypothetical protein